MSNHAFGHNGYQTPEQLCVHVETGLEAAKKSDDPLKDLALVIADLRRLRKLFRNRRTELAALEPRLKAIGAGLDQLAVQLGGGLAECWLDIDQELHDLQNEREACRELMLRYCKNQQVNRLSVGNAELRLNVCSRLELPPIGSHARRELENLLRSSPLWASISELRPLQLMRLWKQGGLHPHLAHRIQTLCRLAETLVVRLEEPSGAAPAIAAPIAAVEGELAEPHEEEELLVEEEELTVTAEET